MCCYGHLTINERESILVMREKGMGINEIARNLARSKSTISRELKRNSRPRAGYSAAFAEELYRKRRERCHRRSVLSDDEKRAKVTELLERYWSPEQIHERLKMENGILQLGTSTIYRAIHSKLLEGQVKLFLRTKPYHKKHRGKVGRITISHNIRERPPEANQRAELGHWESDTLRGKATGGCLATHVDRKSRYLIAAKIPNKSTDAYISATIQLFRQLPKGKVRTFTVDNGKEFANHAEITSVLNAQVYFCDPSAPGQKGTNENTNGLLRQFFPKLKSFERVSQTDVDRVVLLLNLRPRKCLGWKTPFEVFSSLSLHLT